MIALILDSSSLTWPNFSWREYFLLIVSKRNIRHKISTRQSWICQMAPLLNRCLFGNRIIYLLTEKRTLYQSESSKMPNRFIGCGGNFPQTYQVKREKGLLVYSD